MQKKQGLPLWHYLLSFDEYTDALVQLQNGWGFIEVNNSSSQEHPGSS